MAAASSKLLENIACEYANFAHAVNSSVLLAKALQTDCINFIETDIIVIGGAPVLGHDHGHASDLTLQQLVNVWKAASQASLRGLKLDFKEAGALEAALEAKWLKDLPVPRLQVGGCECPALMVNADVLPGDISCSFRKEPLATDAGEKDQVAHNSAIVDVFVRVLRQRSDLVLSLSWSTASEDGEYTALAIDGMRKLVAEIRQTAGVHAHVTYPIRASWVRNSWKELMCLLEGDEACSFTVWSNAPVSRSDEEWMRETLPPTRTMYDLPELQS